MGSPLRFHCRGEEIYFEPACRSLIKCGSGDAPNHPELPRLAPLELSSVAESSLSPREMHLLISAECNLACSYCMVDSGRTYAENGLMPTDVAEASVDWLFRSTGPEPGALTITFFGGEPLLNPAVITAVVKKALVLSDRHGLGVKLHMVTNLTRMSEETARFLAGNDVTVAVSIDGPASQHDTHRTTKGGIGSYDSVVKNLAILQRHLNPRKIWARATLTNGTSVLDSFRHIRDLGFRRINLMPCLWDTLYMMETDCYVNGLDQVMEEWLEAVRDGEDLQVLPLRLWLKTIYGFLGMNQKTHFMDCGAGVDLVAVSPTGDIYTCPMFAADNGPRKWVIGNVFTKILPDKIAEFNQRIGDGPEDCSSCWAHPVCDKGCKLRRFEPGDRCACAVKNSYKTRLWQLCLYWYAHLRDTEPATLLRIVDPQALMRNRK